MSLVSRRLFGYGFALLLGSISGQAWAATGVQDVQGLLQALTSYVRSPNFECDWRAWHSKDAKHLATLHQKLASDLIVEWGNGLKATVSAGGISQASVETYLAGPPTISVRLNSSSAVSIGDRLSVLLVDDAGRRWPLFCGYVFYSAATPTRGVDLLAIQPRPDGAGDQREFQEMNAADVVNVLANDLGLISEVDNLGERLPRITQREGDFDFLRRLARESHADLYLDSNDRIVMRESSFALPAWPPPQGGIANAPRRTRSWYNMKDSDVLAAVAQEFGRSSGIDATDPAHEEVQQNNETDYEFIYRLAERNELDVYFEPNRLVVTRGNVKRPPILAAPNRPTLPGGIVVDVAARNRLPVDLRVGPERPITWPTNRVTDPALLFGTLYRAGYTLFPDRQTLRVTASSALGDFTDHLPLRVTFAATSSTPSLRRAFGGVNRIIANPDRTAEETLTAQIKRATPRALSRLQPNISRKKVDPALLRRTAAGLAVVNSASIAIGLEEALTALSAAHDSDPVARFLLSVARDYRQTLVHMYRRLPDGQARLAFVAAGGAQ